MGIGWRGSVESRRHVLQVGYKQCPALPGEGAAGLFSSRCLVSYPLPLPFPTTFAASTDLTQIRLGSSGLAQLGRATPPLPCIPASRQRCQPPLGAAALLAEPVAWRGTAAGHRAGGRPVGRLGARGREPLMLPQRGSSSQNRALVFGRRL